MSTRISLTILAVVAVIHSVPAWALGLGDARVQSFIGQPLELHIDLLTSPSDDLGSVSARLASAEDFALIGASRDAISVPLNFNIRDVDDRSGAFILVTSRLAVSNPVLRLVVEVNWSSGRLLREYTVFLDPPTVPSQAPEPVTAISEPAPVADPAPDPAPSVAATEPERVESAPQPVSDVEEAPAESVLSETTSPASSTLYGPIRDGETLWQIAADHMGGAGLDMNQIMVAIQRKNPNAFVNSNINLLKRGATLDLPTQEEVSDLSRAEARAMVAQQEAAFRMRSSLASASTPLVASESVSVPDDAVAQVGNPEDGETDERDLAPADESVSRLEIVPASEEDLASGEPGTGAVPGGEGSDAVDGEIREELARTEEALISAQQENEYLQDRIAELEAQLGESDPTSSDGLIADDELADLEERLESERLAGEDETTPVEQAIDSEVPRVVTTSDDDSERPWYSGTMTWLIMIVIVLAALGGWIFNRRRAVEHYELDTEPLVAPVAGLKDEAEEILRTLDSDPDSEDEAVDNESEDDLDDSGESGAVEDTDSAIGHEEIEEPKPVVAAKSRQSSKEDHGDATVLDENSSDPEIQLDLARAYISMGDKEAARAILDEVLNLGNEEQKAEAQKMMDQI